MSNVFSGFWSSLSSSDPNDCWEWQKARNGDGYGSVFLFGRPIKTHRLAWELAYGPIPEHESYHGMCVCHHCDNPPCCNPAHLFLGTHRENALDRRSKGRDQYQKRNWANGERQGAAKLTDADVAQMRLLRDAGWRVKELAEHFSVSRGHVSVVVRGLKRAEITRARR